MSTPYLNMNLPVVSVTPGPEWAEDLNTALDIIDDHDHTSGKGRPITSAALNINDDVSANNHNITSARSFNLSDQSTPISNATDVRSLYSVLGELYYNDSVGNQVQLTLDGAINATSIGGIGGDYATSTASVTYSSTSKTFFFYQNTNQSAKLDVGDLIIHETVANANGITLKSPSSLAASYIITLPTALPASNLMLQMSTTGALSPQYVSTSHIDPAGLGSAAYAPQSVGTAALADGSVTAAKLDSAAGFVKISKQVFNSATGLYPLLIPTGVERAIVKAAGGGGGGGGGDFGSSFGGGGGAGAQARTSMVSVVASVDKTFAPTDVNISTEFITLNAHGYAASQVVVFSSSGTLPGGLTANTVYYIKAPTTNTFQVSTTPGGSAVNLTTQGTGTHTVTNGYAVFIGAGGTAGAGNNSDGGDGGETYLSSGPFKLCRFPGGAHGIAATIGGTAGIGGTNFTWDNQSTSGGGDSTPGFAPVLGDGLGGAAAGSGGGGGGSIGNGGNGGVTGTATNATNGTFGGGGGGGGGGTGTQCGAGGAGYLEVVYWENINP